MRRRSLSSWKLKSVRSRRCAFLLGRSGMVMSMSDQSRPASLLAAPSFEQQGFVAGALGLQFLEPGDEALEAASAHGAFFADSGLTLDAHIQLVVLRQQLHSDAFAGFLPGEFDEFALELAESAFGRADEVLHGWLLSTAHLLQNVFGGDAAAERSETDATKEHPKGEREGGRERVNPSPTRGVPCHTASRFSP